MDRYKGKHIEQLKKTCTVMVRKTDRTIIPPQRGLWKAFEDTSFFPWSLMKSGE